MGECCVSIKSDKWRQDIQNASTFHELDVACRKLPALHLCTDEILSKVNTLPIIEPDEGFVQYLCEKAIDASRVSPQTQCGFVNTAANLLKVYATRVADEGKLASGTKVTSWCAPILVVSAAHRDKIGEAYFLMCDSEFNGCDTRILQALFVDGQYDIALNLSKDNPDLHRAVTNMMNVMISETAYSDYLAYVDERNHRTAFNTDIQFMATLIAKNCELRSKSEWEKSQLDEEDIYYWLTYMLATYGMTQYVDATDTWNDTAIKMYAEELFQSLGVLNKQIGNMQMIEVNWKLELINQLIQKSFILFKKTKTATPARIAVIERCMEHVSFHKDANEEGDVGAIQLAVSIPASERWLPDRCVIATEEYDETSTIVDKASRKIYRGYKSYKDAEKKVDSQLSKMAIALKQQLSGNPRDRIIEGEKFSVVRVIKKIVTTAAIFSFNKVAGIMYVIIKYCTGKKADNKERRAIISELKLEIKLLDEKIEDARGDGNRQAKYSMMRTRAELQKAVDQIQYGLEADKHALQTAKDVMSGRKSTAYAGGRGGDETE